MKDARRARLPVFKAIAVLITLFVAAGAISNIRNPPDGFAILAQRPITITLLCWAWSSTACLEASHRYGVNLVGNDFASSVPSSALSH
jgi:hypothetical protein